MSIDRGKRLKSSFFSKKSKSYFKIFYDGIIMVHFTVLATFNTMKCKHVEYQPSYKFMYNKQKYVI